MKRTDHTPAGRDRRERQKVRYHQRKARGVCPTCATPVERFTYCQACREHRASWLQRRSAGRQP